MFRYHRLQRLWFLVAILFVCAVALAPSVLTHVRTAHFESDVTTEKKPWTHLNFYNDPMNFQFAIISDRTGGLRPGVFADGIQKLNLIMPEFVMSVGDFIPGNTQDRAQLATEWSDFDAVLDPLKVPFFFVPGNHDINNDVMRDVWMERSGVPFYSFVYKNVLFLAVDTTGEKGDIIPEYQVEYMKQALARHSDVRWTYVFMHHPLWLYDNPGGFPAVQDLLKDRPHTVIAGHSHRYLHEWRGNANYYVLATTGGGSKLRGARFGEFDHVTLVTVTEDGPVMVNLRLDGILPHDVTTRADYEWAGRLMRATRIEHMLLTDREDGITAGTLYLTFANPGDRDLKVEAKFGHGHEVSVDPGQLNMTLAAHSQQIVEVAVRSSEPLSTQNPTSLQLHWTMGYGFEDEEDLVLSGTKNIPLRPSSTELFSTVAPEFVDRVSVALAEPQTGYTLRYTTDGQNPTTGSAIYETPLTIDGLTTVKARRFNDRGHGTATATQSYRPVPPGTGLRYRFYKGNWTRMPDFDQLTPEFESVTSDLNVESRQLVADNWGMILEGDLQIEKTGEYTFFLNSDDGSLLYIDDQLVINNDGDHSLLELSGKTQLSAGSHRLRLEFFDAEGEAVLELEMEGPDMPRQPLPFDKVSH